MTGDAPGPCLLAYLRAQREHMIGFLEEMTVAESPSSVPDAQRHVRALLATALSELGFVTARAGPANLYARPQRRERHAPYQLLLGHFDTVWPLGTLREMPFTVDGNEIRGPGVFDMKGGLTQIVFALGALRHLELEPGITPVVFVNSDEEIGSPTSTRYIRMLARFAARAYVMEPALGPEGNLKTTRKGVGRFTITVHGQAAHAGLDPGGGASAILELSYVIQKLFALNDPARGVSVNVGTVDGGLRPNVIAPHSQAVVDVRVSTEEDARRVEDAIRELEPERQDIRLQIDGGIGRPALEATPRNRALWSMAQRLGTQIGLDLQEAHAGGGSDGNTTSRYTATLDGLGPVGDGAHARHEFLDIEKTIDRTALLALLIMAPVAEHQP